MPSYICPYCNYPIEGNNVLFQYRSQRLPYKDARRFAYYHLCSSNWTLESDKFEGLYFFASDVEDGQIELDSNGFPQTLRVKPCNGKTPSELENMEIPGRKLDDFIAQYYNNTTPYTAAQHISTPTSYDVQDDAFSAAAFGQVAAPAQQDPDAEIKPADDGSTVLLATRACPNCHNELHQKFGLIDTINVTLLGGPSAGKTAYLISLVHQLAVQLSARGLGTAVLLSASKRYYDYLNSGFQNLGSTMPTPGQEKLFPFIFYYRNHQKECFVKFSDIAGETTSEADSLLNHTGTMEASNLMLILDPNQLNQGLYYAIKNHGAGDASNINSFNKDIVSFATESIASNVNLGAFKNVRNIVAVFSKMDMVLEANRKFFGAGETDVNCIIRYDLGLAHQGGLSLQVINRIQKEMNIIIAQALGQRGFNLLYYLRSLFPADRKISMVLLGVSTQTLVDAKNIVFENQYHESASKHRIIEPFLCILAQNGMIPVFRPQTDAPNKK